MIGGVKVYDSVNRVENGAAGKLISGLSGYLKAAEFHGPFMYTIDTERWRGTLFLVMYSGWKRFLDGVFRYFFQGVNFMYKINSILYRVSMS